MAWYIVLNPSLDAKEGVGEANYQYANIKQDRWVFYRNMATYWFREDKAETAAVSVAMRKPEYVGRIEVKSFPLPGYR